MHSRARTAAALCLIETLEARIGEEDAEIEALKAQNSAFEKRLANIEAALQKMNAMSSVKRSAVETAK